MDCSSYCGSQIQSGQERQGVLGKGGGGWWADQSRQWMLSGELICQWMLFRQKVIEAALMDVISIEHLVLDYVTYSLLSVTPFSC